MWTEESIETGSTISMTPIGQEPVELRIEGATEPGLFIDVAERGDVVVRTIFRVERVDDERNRVTYRLDTTGRAADRMAPELGPEIISDFPRTLLR